MIEKQCQKYNIKDFVVSARSSIKECLIKFNNNKKSFLIVTHQNNVIGVVTEGDIRRQIINDADIDKIIKYKMDFYYLCHNDTFDKVSSLFKLEEVEFLPILNKSKELVSVITKKQFHVMLLHDQSWSLDEKFLNIDESSIDHEIYNRPWGFYKTVWLCPESQVKVITIFPNEELSLQSHNLREEHWIVVKGSGEVILNDTVLNVFSGSYIYISKESKHQIKNNSNSNIVFCEVQLGEYFGEDDINRFYDKYDRD